MDRISITVKVFFQDPFWIGLCERTDSRGCSVCKITFGPEPKEYEVQEFISQNWYRLSFSPAVAEAVRRTALAGKTLQINFCVAFQFQKTGIKLR